MTQHAYYELEVLSNFNRGGVIEQWTPARREYDETKVLKYRDDANAIDPGAWRVFKCSYVESNCECCFCEGHVSDRKRELLP